MNMDNFEKFVTNHRDAFDDRTPSGKVWARIARALFGAKQISLWNSLTTWRLAAGLLLGLSIVQGFVGRISGESENDIALQQEFIDVEAFYAAQIIEKVSLIRNNELFSDDQLSQDFEKLEAMYAVLAEELKKNPSEKVKDALVLNMLVRIDLLNQQIQKLEDSKRKKAAASTT